MSAAQHDNLEKEALELVSDDKKAGKSQLRESIEFEIPPVPLVQNT